MTYPSFDQQKGRNRGAFLLVYQVEAKPKPGDWGGGLNVVRVSTCSQDMNTSVDPSYSKMHACMASLSCPCFLRRGGANLKLLGACSPEKRKYLGTCLIYFWSLRMSSFISNGLIGDRLSCRIWKATRRSRWSEAKKFKR